MLAPCRRTHLIAIAALTVLGALPHAAVRAEPVADRLLSSVRVVENNGCAVVKIDFNLRVQYQNHFPQGSGDELRIQIHPLDKLAGDKQVLAKQESLRAPSNERAAIHAIELEQIGPGAKLTVYFKRNVAYKVAQGVDFKSVLIAIAGPSAAASCNPVQNAVGGDDIAQAQNGLRGSLSAANKVKSLLPPAELLADEQRGQLVAEARMAIEKSNFDRAVQLLTRLLDAGESKYRQDGLEMLGEARERRGQMAHARAEYKEYLKQYPSGPGSERVRQRLAAIEAAGTAIAVVPPTPAAGAAAPKQVKLGGDGDKSAGGNTVVSADGTRLLPQTKSPAEWTVSQYGSVSTFYNLNQGGRGFIETPRTNVGWDKEDPYRTYQSAFLSNADYDARFENAAYAGRFKFSASQQNSLISSQGNDTRISTLYLDGRIKDSGISTRLGRQSSTNGGVLGRFDGAVAGYQLNDTVKLTAIAGSPVERSRDTPFSNDRYFYGLGSELSYFSKSLETSYYYIEQRAEGLLDRQSVGTEVRYVKDGGAGYGAIEYDLHFGQINSTVLTGNKIFTDQSSASINLDYRRSPVLLASNALQGQGVYTLSELMRRYSLSEIDQLAFDRTAQSYTGTASYSRPLNSRLQWVSDLTVNYLSGMPASGGIEAIHSTGMAYYAATQLIGTSVLRDGDSASVGVRYANTETSDRYMLEFGTYYPITRDWRVNPMLRFGYGQYKMETRAEYQVIPSVRTSYQVRPDTQLEFEIGGKIGLTDSPLGREYQTDLLFLAGVRYDFSNSR